jgi:formylglycine-generating enzyme required for sulfatase activity
LEPKRSHSSARSPAHGSSGKPTRGTGFRVALVGDLAPPPPAVAPFDTKKATEHQDAWAKHLGIEPEIKNSIGMKLRLIPAGKFMMGSPETEAGRDANEGPQHGVMLSKPYFLGASAVTVGQFKEFVKAKGYKTDAETDGGAYRRTGGFFIIDPKCTWLNPGWEQTDEHPVVAVSRRDAQAFCDWLSEKEGKQYALPTEAQWEYACRAGSQTRYFFGDDVKLLGRYAWYENNSEWKAHPVAQKEANAWGLYDMHGNVRQWAADWFAADYYQKSPKEDPPGPSDGADRVFRGGGWVSHEGTCRAAHRGIGQGRSHRGTDIGFRVALVGDLKDRTPPLAVAPFDEKQAKAHQEAWARHLGVPVEMSNSTGMKLRLIPPGEFLMGTSEAEMKGLRAKVGQWQGARFEEEGPQHKVTIAQPFYLGAHEVTVAQFRAFVDATGYKTKAEVDGKGGVHYADGKSEHRPQWTWRTPPFPQQDDHPVVHISWNDAQAYCQWLSEREGRSYVLPSEEQWEFACRAGSLGKWSFGDDQAELPQYAWAGVAVKGTSSVGGRKPNAFGLFEMHGNAMEWCADAWVPHRAGTADQKKPDKEQRAVRGGNFMMGFAPPSSAI